MARLNITNLPKPPRDFRPDRESDASTVRVKFETKVAAKREDNTRLQLIKAITKRLRSSGSSLTEKQISRLKKHIAKARGAASSVYMRKLRIRIAGNLWALVVAADCTTVSTFTLIPCTWEFRGGCLDQADPRKLLAELRQTLWRCGAKDADGWLFAAIHGEHEPNEDVYRLHIHGACQGEMREVIDRLRTRKNYRSQRGELADQKVFQRVRRTRAPLADLPNPLTYIVQSFWPERAIFKTASGDVNRQTKKWRISDPQHTEVLRWLDRWTPSDTTLLMGIEVCRSGFRKATKRTPVQSA